MLAAQDKTLADAVYRVAYHMGNGYPGIAQDAWADLPAAFRAKYAGVTLDGDLIPAMGTGNATESKVGFYDDKTATPVDPTKIAENLRVLMEKLATDQRQKETPTMTTPTTESKTPDLAREMENAAWRAGIEIATEEGRDLLIALLTDGMDEGEATIARPLFVKAFAGRFGVPIVAGAIGGVMYAVEASGMEVPLVSRSLAARIGEEMRTLTASSVMKVAYRSGRDLLAKHGARMVDALTNLGKIAERTGVRVDPAPASVEASTETQATAGRAFVAPASSQRAA